MREVSQDELNDALRARVTAPVYDKLRSARVAIAGLGGLGSHVAMMLARAGVGHLLLVDFDCVDVSNINRQAYLIEHIGMPKVEALALLLRAVNPAIELSLVQERVTMANAVELFSTYSLVCEAFDSSDQKAMLVNTLLAQCPSMHLVAASGMAGYAPANEIVTRAAFSRLTLCGDAQTDLADDIPLLASRVMLCAAHQAHALIRMILDAPAC